MIKIIKTKAKIWKLHKKIRKKVGAAESDPSTTGPTETLREEAAQNTGESDSKEPA